MCRTAPPWLEEHRRTVRIFWPASTGVGSFRSWFLLPRHWPDSGRSLFFSLRDQILSLQQRPRDMICPAAGPSSSHFGAGRGAYASAGNLTFRCQLATAGCTASSVCFKLDSSSGPALSSENSKARTKHKLAHLPGGDSLQSDDRRGQQAEESLEKRGLFRNTVNTPATAAIASNNSRARRPSFLLSEIIFFSNSLRSTPMPACAGFLRFLRLQEQAYA